MAFICRYIASNGQPEYYRTVYADSVNEAAMLAKRWQRKLYGANYNPKIVRKL